MKECSRCGEVKPLTSYYKQKDCKFGVSARCKECAKKERAEKYKANPDKAKNASSAWRKNNPEKIAEYERKAAAKRLEAKLAKIAGRKGKTAAQIWLDLNKEKQRKWLSASQRKRLSTPKGKLEHHMRTGIVRRLMRGGKKGKRTFEILDFTVDQLKSHLEKNFSDGMTWDNYGRGRGKWNIDHIEPLAAFSYETVQDPSFKRAWRLSNLRPMWAPENSAKGPRIAEKYGNAHLLLAANDNHRSCQEESVAAHHRQEKA